MSESTRTALAYQTIVVPQAENALPTPGLLPPLDPRNARSYDGTEDVELTVEGIDGLTLNQVHRDDVPMPMPDGVAPPFA